jgi:hypothetical protein
MSMEIRPDNPEDLRASQEAGYEKRDVNVAALLKFGFWMAILLIVTFLGMRWTFNYFSRTQTLGAPTSPFARARELPPNPRIQVTPHLDLQMYCQGQEEEVNTYAWVDQRLGVVRIPVDRAMDLVLQRGLPSRSGAAPAGSNNVTPDPAAVAGGADLQGPCGYLAPSTSSESSASAEK